MVQEKVYFVGGGPGAADLLTVKGDELIKKAAVIVHDADVSADVLSLAGAGAKFIKVGKSGTQVSIKEAVAGLVKGLKGRGIIVRLVKGDTFVFNTSGEEAEFLSKKNIGFEVVPGIIDSVGASGYSGIPLSRQGREKTITLARSKGCGLDSGVLKRDDVLAVSVYGAGLKTIIKDLLGSGASKTLQVSVIKDATTSNEVTVSGTLATMVEKVKKAGLESPYTVIIDGNKKGKGRSLNLPGWFESKPLFGKRVMVTRTIEQSKSFVDILNKSGAEPIICPTIKITPPKSFAKLDSCIKSITKYDWIVFTSANGVRCFKKRLFKLKKDVRELKGLKVCAIGPKTQKTVEVLFGINVDLTPKEYVAEGILKEFKKSGIKGRRFFLPRATEAREILPDEIRRLGGFIDVAPVYKTIRPKKEAELARKLIKKGQVDVITFTSSSTVTNFVAGYKKGELEKIIGDSNVVIACIGPVTRDTALRAGITVHVTAKKYTVDGLAEALEKFYQRDAGPNSGGN